MSLRQKTITGLAWSSVSQGVKVLSQFIITVILARLLLPNDFGLLAMATVFMNFAMIFSEMGISSALVQKQDTHDRHYHSAFWLNLITGFCLTLIFIAVSPLIAMFYKRPELQSILMVLAINFFISSFVIVQQTILTKEMEFKKLAVRDILAVVISGVIGIFFACSGFGVWSLVYQSIAFTTINSLFLWTVSSWRPKFVFATQDIKDIFRFSANLTVFQIANYFSRNIDQLLIGKFLGAQMLGYYSLAYKIMLYPLQNISVIVGKVMFPALSKIQGNLVKVREIYAQMIESVALVTFPLMAVIFATAPEFVRVIWGEKWIPMIPLIRILSVCGMLQSIHTTCGGLLLSQGKSGLQLRLGVWSAILNTIAISIGMRWGIYGVAACYMIIQLIWISYAQQVCNNTIDFKLNQFIKHLRPVFINSVIMAVAAACVACIFKASVSIAFAAQLVICTVLYFALVQPIIKIKELGIQK
jgi:PST family polysaccharide transporter